MGKKFESKRELNSNSSEKRQLKIRLVVSVRRYYDLVASANDRTLN